MSSNGTSEEPTVTIWGDGHIRGIGASLVSRFDTSRDLDVQVDVVDFNDDQKPTVVLGVGTDAGLNLFMTAYDAERLSVYLAQAAALSRHVEPGGPNPLLVRQVPAER
ncbi:hypothetical protein ACAG24_025170 [Mycobacterium sp. pW049]|uniref:hypothetical protein n=1 Tax=[Mycobacterium] bulgaricum TaxID=3238985 RepID=UPI00351AF628